LFVVRFQLCSFFISLELFFLFRSVLHFATAVRFLAISFLSFNSLCSISSLTLFISCCCLLSNLLLLFLVLLLQMLGGCQFFVFHLRSSSLHSF
jgi:hypothetical protein